MMEKEPIEENPEGEKKEEPIEPPPEKPSGGEESAAG